MANQPFKYKANPNLVPWKFYIDNANGVEWFDGFYDPEERWNGFACPYFTYEQAEIVMDAVFRPASEDVQTPGEYWGFDDDGAADFFGFDSEGNEERIKPVEVKGKDYWRIGAYAWTWHAR